MIIGVKNCDGITTVMVDQNEYLRLANYGDGLKCHMSATLPVCFGDAKRIVTAYMKAFELAENKEETTQ